MAQLPFDGNFRVFVVDTVADIAAPTSAEITAGTEITALLPKSGWSETPTFNRVAAGNMSTLYDAEVMGTWKTTITLTILLDDTADLAWDEFQVQGARTNLVVLPYKGTDAVAAADKSRCYPVEVARAIPNASAANERQTAEVACAVYSEPALDGAVAA